MWAFIHFNQIRKVKLFIIGETTQETPNVPLMKPIKTFHQSLRQGFDTEDRELNYRSDSLKINCACVSNPNSGQAIFDLNHRNNLRNIESALKA